MPTDEHDLQRLNMKPDFTILIVDDMDNIRRALIADLRSLKFNGKILEADTLTKAKTILETEFFDLVICDRNLPDGSGVNFLLALRAHPRLSKVPLLMCTTVSELKLVIDAIKQGANEYITKPWIKDVLVKKILTIVPSHLL